MANLSTHLQPQPWQWFCHPVVRDLAWVIASPALMSPRLGCFSALDFDQSTQDSCLEWLARLDRPAADGFIIDKSQFRRLGLYFEALVAFLFSRGWDDGVIPYRLLGRNLRIMEGNKTLGELDMLLEDRRGDCIHLECAVKFYLAHRPGTGEWQNWIGPNARDRLDIKLRHMLTHQLTIATHPAARVCLESHNRDPRTVQSRYLLRGMFFPHADSLNCGPVNANPAALTGRWLRGEQFAVKYGRIDHGWKTLTKLDWLTRLPGVQSATHNESYSPPKTPPKMLCRNTSSGAVEKLMLVADYWPDTRSPSRRM